MNSPTSPSHNGNDYRTLADVGTVELRIGVAGPDWYAASLVSVVEWSRGCWLSLREAEAGGRLEIRVT